MVVFHGRIFLVSDISFAIPCSEHSLDYPKRARCSEEHHVNDNKVFVGKEIWHALDGEPHLHHLVEHNDVKQDEHGD